jgi:hypothetical protein
MYHSHSYQDEAFGVFVSFLRNVINGDQKYAELILPIITDAHELATGEKTYFTINRDNYTIITFLVESSKDYFQTLNTGNIIKSDYQRILEVVSSQRELVFA